MLSLFIGEQCGTYRDPCLMEEGYFSCGNSTDHKYDIRFWHFNADFFIFAPWDYSQEGGDIGLCIVLVAKV